MACSPLLTGHGLPGQFQSRRQVVAMTAAKREQFGQLAAIWCGKHLPLQVCASMAGFYLGTLNPDGTPCSRESVEYWRRHAQATEALQQCHFTQRPEP
jgi:hypothetical protein